MMDPISSEQIDEEEETLLEKYPAPIEPRFHFAGTCAKFIMIQLFLIILYTAALYLVCQSAQQFAGHEMSLYSPAASAIKYQIKTFDRELNTSSIYTAAPSPEVDAAWDELYKNAEIRVSAEDLRKINRTSVAFADGSGYLATLDVMHQLHCVNHIRKYIYREHYPQNFGFDDDEVHVAHCLQTLLHIIQCRADISLLTYEWKPHYRKPWPRFDVVHECRDWDAVAEWAEVHGVDTKGEILVNPEMGVVFPLEEEDKV